MQVHVTISTAYPTGLRSDVCQWLRAALVPRARGSGLTIRTTTMHTDEAAEIYKNTLIGASLIKLKAGLLMPCYKFHASKTTGCH